MSRIRELFSREKVVSALKSIFKLRIKVSHASLIHFSILSLILVIAFTIRLMPLRWGYYLSEFDPYYQYRLTKDMVQEGVVHWTTWRDMMSWWPYGRDVPRTSFPGLALTAATLYSFLNALGVPMAPSFASDPLAVDPVYNFVIIFPVIMATLTCIVIYFFGRDIGGNETGLFAALFLALNASYIGRTTLGFFDDETVGIFGILLTGFFFLRAIEAQRPFKDSLAYAIASGLSLGYLFASWGASRYAAGLLMLLVFVMLILRRYSPRLLMSYSATFGVALFVAISVPYVGPKFLTEITNLAALGLLLLLCAFEVSRHIKTVKMKSVFAVSFLSVLIILFVLVSLLGYISPLKFKFTAVLNPFQRFLFPLTESVQEHRPAAWGSIYYDVGIGIFFIPVGLYFAAQNPTNRNLFLIIFGLTSVYFASSMVRLTLIMAPALCLLWAYALTRVLRPFITVLKETPTTIGRRTRFEAHVGKEFSASFIILLFLLLSFTFVVPSRESQLKGYSFPRVVDQAYVPTTMAASGIPVKPLEPISDWIDALTWMRNNDSVQVVASWWDYGYWITTAANKKSLADNGTFNSTQIQKLAEMFVSNETRAVEILEHFNSAAHKRGMPENITHVAVFTTFTVNRTGFGIDGDYGDEGKWVWMARIAERFTGVNETAFATPKSGNDDWTDLGKKTVIYKLMTLAKRAREVQSDTETVANYPYTPERRFKLAYFSNQNHRELWAPEGIHVVVAIYEVLY